MNAIDPVYPQKGSLLELRVEPGVPNRYFVGLVEMVPKADLERAKLEARIEEAKFIKSKVDPKLAKHPDPKMESKHWFFYTLDIEIADLERQLAELEAK